MPNFWDGLNQNNRPINNGNFNIQDFLRFSQQMKGKDATQMLQDMVASGKVTNEQLENAKSQANGILQMLQTMGFVK